jgi:hypothetical protein
MHALTLNVEEEAMDEIWKLGFLRREKEISLSFRRMKV